MAGFTTTEFIWMNGELVPWEAAQVHVTAHGLHYGTGVFEGIRSYDTPDGPAIFRLDAHMHRLAASAQFYEIALPYSFDQLCTAALELIRANGLDNAYIRPIAFFDSRSFSVWPVNWLAEAAPLGGACLRCQTRVTRVKRGVR